MVGIVVVGQGLAQENMPATYAPRPHAREQDLMFQLDRFNIIDFSIEARVMMWAGG